jgi:hypothetical protein
MSNPLNLPVELSSQVISYLDKRSLGKCNQLSREWKVATDYFLKKAEQLKSNDEIIRVVQSFLADVSLGKNAKFTCLLSLGRNYQILSVEVKGTKAPIIRTPNELSTNLREFHFTEHYIAVNGISDGSLATLDLPEYQLRSTRALSQRALEEHSFVVETPIGGPFQAMLRFPTLPNSAIDNLTPIEKRIQTLLRQKIGELRDQADRQKAMMQVTAALIVLVIAYYVLFQVKP